jgi:hypothetical protein
MIPMGKVEKMQIQAYTGPADDKTPISEPYKFLVNPSTYTEHFAVQYNEDVAPGNNGTELKYQGQPPGDWEFELLIDGTGVVKEANALDIQLIGSTTVVDVPAEVAKLKHATVDVQGETHRNAYLIVSWGDRDVFKGSLVSLDLNYKLFKPNGTPLRVIAKLRLRAWVDATQRNNETALASPDITHERTFKAGDKFALMGYRIYSDSNYYLDVARANRMNSFRKISIGRKIKFPPIK